jgi:hypothetical protein
MASWYLATMSIEISEEQRQLILLALASLAVERPGFDLAMNTIAIKMDNVQDGRGELYDQFRSTR